MTLIDIQDNPVVAKQGTRLSDATIIESEIVTSNTVHYQIEDRSNGVQINVNSTSDVSNTANVIAVSSTRLKVILKERTKYKVRVKDGNGSWGSWVNFKTRDRRYQSPDNITQLTDNSDSTAGTTKSGVSNGGNRRIVVTNNAKAAVTIHSVLTSTNKGARIVNSDTLYADTTSITNTSRGAKTINDTTIVYTNRGATINNN